MKKLIIFIAGIAIVLCSMYVAGWGNYPYKLIAYLTSCIGGCLIGGTLDIFKRFR